MTYMINEWHGNSNNDTGCLLRTEDRALWKEKAKEYVKEYKLTDNTCRVIKYADRTIFSFISTASAVYSYNHGFFKQPKSVRKGFHE